MIMGHLYVASGPGNGQQISYTHDVHYVCDSDCLIAAILHKVSVQWATVCAEVSSWKGDAVLCTDGRPAGEFTTYEIGFDPNESPSDDHEYCWACGDQISHAADCDVEHCEAPKYRDAVHPFGGM